MPQVKNLVTLSPKWRFLLNISLVGSFITATFSSEFIHWGCHYNLVVRTYSLELYHCNLVTKAYSMELFHPTSSPELIHWSYITVILSLELIYLGFITATLSLELITGALSPQPCP
jgi:hypothetical protein